VALPKDVPLVVRGLEFYPDGGRLWLCRRRHPPANPKDLPQHVLWALGKPDGRTLRAAVRQVPQGIELVIFFKGELRWSEVFADSRQAGAQADAIRREWEARGWAPVGGPPACHPN
jgi:hypothetical protein